MKAIKFLVLLIILGLLGVLVYQNLEYFTTKQAFHIDLKREGWQWTIPELPNYAFWGIWFGLGLLITGMRGLATAFRLGREIKKKEAVILDLREEITELKVRLDVFIHDPYIKKRLAADDGAAADTGDVEDAEDADAAADDDEADAESVEAEAVAADAAEETEPAPEAADEADEETAETEEVAMAPAGDEASEEADQEAAPEAEAADEAATEETDTASKGSAAENGAENPDKDNQA